MIRSIGDTSLNYKKNIFIVELNILSYFPISTFEISNMFIIFNRKIQNASAQRTALYIPHSPITVRVHGQRCVSWHITTRHGWISFWASIFLYFVLRRLLWKSRQRTSLLFVVFQFFRYFTVNSHKNWNICSLR